MTIDDCRLRHPVGFLKVANPPSAGGLRTYYHDKYYQQEPGNYRRSYPPEERTYLEFKFTHWPQQVSVLRAPKPSGFPGRRVCRGLRDDSNLGRLLDRPLSAAPGLQTMSVTAPQVVAAHRARVRTELLLGGRGHAVVNELYVDMVKTELGRQPTAYLTAREET
jgi:hypothetical protein